MLKPDQERIRSLLVDTICLLCRNGLNFESELRVQAVVGITVDNDECFLVHINKCFERILDEDCENEEQLDKALQQCEVKSNEVELQLSQAAVQSTSIQPSCEAPPSPIVVPPSLLASPSPVVQSSHSFNKPTVSQDLSTSCREQNSSQHQQKVSASNLVHDNCASKSDIQMMKSASSKQEAFDECAEYDASKKHTNRNKAPVLVESDCDDSSEVTTDSMGFQQNNGTGKKQQYYNCSQTTAKFRHNVDAYRPKTKRRNFCEDLFDAEDDYCADFNVGQQYMYTDSGRSRARPKMSQQKQQDVFFDPHCQPNMSAYGTQDVRLFTLLSDSQTGRRYVLNILSNTCSYSYLAHKEIC